MEIRVLITGVTGFVGQHIANKLVEQGCVVHGIVRKYSDREIVQKLETVGVCIHYYQEDDDNLRDIVANANPQVVLHLASLFLAQHNYNDITGLIQSNILFGTRLVDAMVQRGVYALVNTGTSWQHHENEAYNPVCLYAATKQAFESILMYYQKTTHLKLITLKLFDTYGPNDKRKKLLNLLSAAAWSGETLAMSPGEQFLDLVYIDDVVDAFCLAIERLLHDEVKSVETYAVSSERLLRLKDLVAICEETWGKRISVDWGKRPYRHREVMMPWRNFAVLPGWKARVVLENGLLQLKCSDEKKEW